MIDKNRPPNQPLIVSSNGFELGLSRAVPFFGNIPTKSSDQVLQIGSELTFGCPAGSASAFRMANGVSAWRYRYMPAWDNTALTPTTGAYHSGEIPSALGMNALRPNVTADTDEEAALTKFMVDAWAEFAKNPVAGLSKLKLPQYDPAGNTLIRLSHQNLSALTPGPSTQYDGPCALYITLS